MTNEDRNYLYEEKAHLINSTMNTHDALVLACDMEDADVYQELSLYLLGAIEEYNPAKSPNMDAYLMLELENKLLDMKACSKLAGITDAPKKGFALLSLDAMAAARSRIRKQLELAVQLQCA